MPYCRDCGAEIYGSRLYCGECANDIVERSRDRIRGADADEQRRMSNDRSYAHSWLQSLIGWIVGLMDLMSKIFSGGCYITSAVVAFKGLADNSQEMEDLRTLRAHCLQSGDEERRRDIESYYVVGPALRDWIDSRNDADLIWGYVWHYVQEVIGLAREARDEEAWALFKKRTLRLRWDVLSDRHACAQAWALNDSMQRTALRAAADTER